MPTTYPKDYDYEHDPNFAFDWYFSDWSDQDGARGRAVESKHAETRMLMALVRADTAIHFALWTELPEGHPIGELWGETQTDLLATVYLAYGGFFRQALTALRSWFEIATHGVYFAGHYGQKTSRYQQWRDGIRHAPANMRDISASIAARLTGSGGTIASADIEARLDPLYSFLSKHAHGQGLDVFDLQAGRDNVPRYLPASFDLWFATVLNAIDAVYYLYVNYQLNALVRYAQKRPSLKPELVAIGSELLGKLPNFDIIVAALP